MSYTKGSEKDKLKEKTKPDCIKVLLDAIVAETDLVQNYLSNMVEIEKEAIEVKLGHGELKVVPKKHAISASSKEKALKTINHQNILSKSKTISNSALCLTASENLALTASEASEVLLLEGGKKETALSIPSIKPVSENEKTLLSQYIAYSRLVVLKSKELESRNKVHLKMEEGVSRMHDKALLNEVFAFEPLAKLILHFEEWSEYIRRNKTNLETQVLTVVNEQEIIPEAPTEAIIYGWFEEKYPNILTQSLLKIEKNKLINFLMEAVEDASNYSVSKWRLDPLEYMRRNPSGNEIFVRCDPANDNGLEYQVEGQAIEFMPWEELPGLRESRLANQAVLAEDYMPMIHPFISDIVQFATMKGFIRHHEAGKEEVARVQFNPDVRKQRAMNFIDLILISKLKEQFTPSELLNLIGLQMDLITDKRLNVINPSEQSALRSTKTDYLWYFASEDIDAEMTYQIHSHLDSLAPYFGLNDISKLLLRNKEATRDVLTAWLIPTDKKRHSEILFLRLLPYDVMVDIAAEHAKEEENDIFSFAFEKLTRQKYSANYKTFNGLHCIDKVAEAFKLFEIDNYEEASYEAAKIQFNKLAIKYHPDRNFSPEAAENFQQIHDAWQQIKTYFIEKQLENTIIAPIFPSGQQSAAESPLTSDSALVIPGETMTTTEESYMETPSSNLTTATTTTTTTSPTTKSSPLPKKPGFFRSHPRFRDALIGAGVGAGGIAATVLTAGGIPLIAVVSTGSIAAFSAIAVGIGEITRRLNEDDKIVVKAAPAIETPEPLEISSFTKIGQMMEGSQNQEEDTIEPIKEEEQEKMTADTAIIEDAEEDVLEEQYSNIQYP